MDCGLGLSTYATGFPRIYIYNVGVIGVGDGGKNDRKNRVGSFRFRLLLEPKIQPKKVGFGRSEKNDQKNNFRISVHTTAELLLALRVRLFL